MSGNTGEKARAAFLAFIMVTSVMAAGVAFSGSAAAQQQTNPTDEVVVDDDFSSDDPGAGEYTTIQAAINNNGSDTLITVNAGTYNETIKIGESGGIDNVTIQGAGVGSSVINGTERAAAIEIGRSPGDNVRASNISISGFTINQNSTAGSGGFAIETTSTSDENITITNNRIVANGSKDGVGAFLPTATNVRIADNEFVVEGGSAREYIATDSASQQFTIEDNTFEGDLARSGQTGQGNAIELRGSNATVINNEFNVSSDGSAIFVTADDVTIEDNDLDGDYNLSDGRTAANIPAIETDTALSNLNVIGNQITDYYAGVQLQGASSPGTTVTDATIEDNTIEDAYFGIGQNGDDGTQVVDNDISAQVQGVSGFNTANMTVEENTISINSSTIDAANRRSFFDDERGVDISDKNATIIDNSFSGDGAGLLVEGGTGHNAHFNTFEGNDVGVTVSDSSVELNLTFNDFVDNAENGLEVTATSPTVNANYSYWGDWDFLSINCTYSPQTAQLGYDQSPGVYEYTRIHTEERG